ncbi:MAG: glycosyltransferase family 2 protein [Candidatus Saccharibacteria bacterium]
MNSLAIIVLNWNGADDTLNCVESLQQQTLRPEIIIVDNNSSDDSVERFEDHIKSQKKDAPILIKNSQNLGFAGGINTGLIYAKEHNFEYIGVLNPDAIADKKWCRAIVDELSTHLDCGIATGIMQRRDGKTLDTTGDFYTTWGLPGPRNRDESIENAPSKPGEVFGATGGGAIYRAAIFDDIDMFDEDFFMYYEDVDLSFRAQLAGWKVRFTPKAIAYHKVGASSKKVPGLAVYNTFKNLPLVFIKNVPRQLFWYIGIRFFLTYWLIFASAVRHGNGWPALKGILASIVHKPAAYKKRLTIQKNRKASVDYIRNIIHSGPLPNQTGLLKFRKFFIRNNNE